LYNWSWRQINVQTDCAGAGNKGQFHLHIFKVKEKLIVETRFLDSFVAVAECGSMAEAARRLSVTPTALAQRVRALEDELNVKFIERSGRTAQLTEGGARLLARARRFQREFRELKAAASDEAFAGELRLGTISTALTGMLPRILATLAQHHPKVDINIAAGVSRSLYHQVINETLDAALIIEPQFAMPKSMVWHLLRTEPLVVLTPVSLAHIPPLELLASQPLIRYDRSNWGGQLADRYLQEQEIVPHERFELDMLDAIALLVDQGLGVSLVPDWPRAWELPKGVAILALPGNPPVRKLGLLWRSKSPFSRMLGELPMLAELLNDTSDVRERLFSAK
jgi:DNA-binding transcriptional LysR family regulator